MHSNAYKANEQNGSAGLHVSFHKFEQSEWGLTPSNLDGRNKCSRQDIDRGLFKLTAYSMGSRNPQTGNEGNNYWDNCLKTHAGICKGNRLTQCWMHIVPTAPRDHKKETDVDQRLTHSSWAGLKIFKCTLYAGLLKVVHERAKSLRKRTQWNLVIRQESCHGTLTEPGQKACNA